MASLTPPTPLHSTRTGTETPEMETEGTVLASQSTMSSGSVACLDRTQRQRTARAMTIQKSVESTDPNTSSAPRGLVTTMSNVESEVGSTKSGDSKNWMQGTSSQGSQSTLETTTHSTDLTLTINPGQWANKYEMLLTILGYIGGFGDAWDFPFMALKYGKGTFVVFFLLFHLLIALPLVYVELVLGQFASLTPVRVFNHLVPIMQGIGWAAIFVCAVRAIYYNVVMAWATFYFVANLISWQTCDHDYNTDCCISKPNTSLSLLANCSNQSLLTRFSAHQLFYNDMYNYKDDVQGLGHLQWQLTLCLLFCWLVTLGCVIRGVASFGIIVYFSSTIPLIIMLIICIFTATLHNAGQGVTHLFTPDPSAFANPVVWTRAGIHVLFSVSPAFGVWITLGSYNPFTNNCFKDALFAVGANAAISLTSGLTIASVLGFTASKFNVSIDTLIGDASRDSAFVIFPQGLVQVDGDVVPVLFNILYYLMLMFIGLNTQFYEIEVVVIAICDQWPRFTRHRWAVAALLCLGLFILGLPMCLERGLSVFTIFSEYSDMPLLYIALLELISVIYIYGWRNLTANIRLMIKQSKRRFIGWIGSSGKVMQWMWFAFTPPMLGVFLVLYFIPSYSVKSSGWLNILGASMVFIPLAIIVSIGAWRIVVLVRQSQPLSALIKPSNQWCPIHTRPKQKPVPRPLRKSNEQSKSASLDLSNSQIHTEIRRY